ncbi:hypothetical protein QVD17_24128 [Tagetes erecta]|uniref:Uncharacterized protein n=1 Tax=Tagetes erecta TaxID=13708 RepID=A0AAD8NUJ9_TARER|nr:hypothetical protein QVD17_24128 [Tagetes erecta]
MEASSFLDNVLVPDEIVTLGFLSLLVDELFDLIIRFCGENRLNQVNVLPNTSEASLKGHGRRNTSFVMMNGRYDFVSYIVTFCFHSPPPFCENCDFCPS